ncbi:DUF7331 family protein [Natronomonas salsuginis]|uniref:DUF7331 family protein n=1 Tax=Natronomonas salsuginis TaxID=2217661 RepID=UPI0014858516|nr:hypothetical protein [Natronomonas salsuginis]
MSAPLENDPDGDSPPQQGGEYVELTLETGEIVIYRADNPSAWIQSDTAVELSSSA